jgi:hypothetical protein
MARQTNRRFLLPLIFATCGFLHGQATSTITIRILDSKTGKPIAPTGYMVRGDHQMSLHLDWVKVNEDGTGELTLPATTSVVSIHDSYDQSTEIYMNCDGEQQKDRIGDIWYSVSEILDKGIVTPNGCAKPKDLAKIKVPDAKPGEIVFFVRQKKGVEKMY